MFFYLLKTVSDANMLFENHRLEMVADWFLGEKTHTNYHKSTLITTFIKWFASEKQEEKVTGFFPLVHSAQKEKGADENTSYTASISCRPLVVVVSVHSNRRLDNREMSKPQLHVFLHQTTPIPAITENSPLLHPQHPKNPPLHPLARL